MADGAGLRLPGIGVTLAGEKLPKLVDLMAHLRGADGCPWDCEQDYDTLKGLLLEEAYEVVDAINARDFDGLEDELGDLLFQVVFYSCLAEEEGRFDIDGVLFEIVPAPDVSALRGTGNARLCLRVDDVEQALKALQAKGARTGQAQRKATGVLGSVEDPDGNEICLWQYL